ncbi:transketolase [Bradyrhizobium jicamae]|uniref:transketolase family protein n=1 Tax=Bradyrhizobium jicamae TaxID=280332 RepID=UPI001BA63969|nr:transketolase C-terminal domain-containing protein [Bradyrhizobium jicamae]MBR0750592.1 transketolase [Bradyrhizobium jicamae]
MRNTFVATLAELAERDPNIWLLCGDLGFSVLESFAAQFPDRFLNMGVAEQNMAGVAAGLALTGKTVFIYSIGNFPTLRCLEQLRNDVCYHGADVKIVSVGAGFAYGSQGYTHHAIEDVAVMSALPGIEVFVPADPAETRSIVRAIAASRRPSYLRLSRAGEPELSGEPLAGLHRPRWLRSPPADVCVLAAGPIAGACLEAARLLPGNISVASVPCLKPIDDGFVRRVAGQARLIVTVEEHILRGGLHAAVSALLAGERSRAPVVGLGIPEADKLSVAGDRDSLLASAGLGPQAIAERIEAALRAL